MPTPGPFSEKFAWRFPEEKLMNCQGGLQVAGY